jgi:quinoprotein glucose dehydrogenase
MKTSLVAALWVGAALLAPLAAGAAEKNVDWAYNGGPAEDHYSPLTEIDKTNVAHLKEAWRFPMASGGLESQPIMIGHTLYVVTTDRQLVALDAATGKPIWTFDPKLKDTQPIRGLNSWKDGEALRIVFGTQNFLYLIDAKTGLPVPRFGDGGRIDVRENLRGPAEDNHIYITSPAMVYKDLIYVNGRVAENTPASPGDVRAYDAHTGKLAWTFHTIPHPGEVGADTWPADAYKTQGGDNAWSGASVDVKRGIVFVNTGSAADDFYGAERIGDDRFANSTIALDALTGKRLWDFQQVHHDLWDSDSTSPPILMTVRHDGKPIDVAVATNKQSYIYVFDRKTGKPVFPIQEQPFGPSDVPGEVAAKTQPIPVLPHPLSRKTFTVNDLTDASAADNAAAKDMFAKLYGGGAPYTPVGLNQNTLVTPGFSGGNEWGGMAADRQGVIYAPVSNAASMTRIIANVRFSRPPDEPGLPPAAGGYQNGVAHLKYTFSGYGRFALPNGHSALKGPLAVLDAVDLNTGEYRWTIPIDSASGGGPVVTASGLLFLGDGGVLKAYDTADGKVLFSQKLINISGLTPAIYRVDGKEYVVLASGGRGEAAYEAFALPN